MYKLIGCMTRKSFHVSRISNDYDLITLDDFYSVIFRLNYKDFPNTIYILADNKYVILSYNNIIRVYKTADTQGTLVVTKHQKKKVHENKYLNELQKDFDLYIKVRARFDHDYVEQIGLMSEEGLSPYKLITTKIHNKYSYLIYDGNKYYNNLFSQKIVLLNKDEFYISHVWNYKDHNIDIVYWKSDIGIDLLSKDLKDIDFKGYYEPANNNLKNIRYEDRSSKHFFENADQSLSGVDKTINKKIDIKSFFALQEKIPSPEQARIYSLNKEIVIIEGSAGTGKTTTALEIIAKKHFDFIKQDKMAVITKDHSGDKYLKNFLSNLSLKEVQTFTIKRFYKDKKIQISLEEIKLSEKTAIAILKYLDSFTQVEFYRQNNELRNSINLYEKETSGQKIQNYITRKLHEINVVKKVIHQYKQDIENEEKKFISMFSSLNSLDQYKQINTFYAQLKRLHNLPRLIATDKEKLSVNTIKYLSKKLIYDEKTLIAEKRVINDIYLTQLEKNEVSLIQNDFHNNFQIIRQLIKRENTFKDLTNKYDSTKVFKQLKDLIYFLKYENYDISNIYKQLGELIFFTNEEYLDKTMEIIKMIPKFDDYQRLINTITWKKDDIKSQKEKLVILQKNLNNLEELSISLNIVKLQTLIKEDIDYWATLHFLNEIQFYDDIDEVEEQVINYISRIYKNKEVINSLVSSFTLSDSINMFTLLSVYRIVFKKDLYNTLILDEAQEYEWYEIEYCRLCTNNLILTGDRLQKISKKGISDWSEIYLYLELYQENIYELSINFRQTYELSNASFNYRKSILNEEFREIKEDYFSNQMGFRKPKIYLVNKAAKYQKIVLKIINSAGLRFTTKFPLAVIFHTSKEKEFYTNIFSNYKIAIYSESTEDFSKEDILLIHSEYIRGKEFPIVLSFIHSYTEKMLYLIMSRANFELYLFANSMEIIPNKLMDLVDKKIIELEAL